MLTAVYLGYYLTEKQEQEGEQYGHDEELQPACLTEVNGLVETEIQDCDDRHVHQIVTDEDGSQQAFAVEQQVCHLFVGVVLAFVYCAPFGWGETEECYLACRDKTGAEEQEQNDGEGNPYVECGRLNADGADGVSGLAAKAEGVMDNIVGGTGGEVASETGAVSGGSAGEGGFQSVGHGSSEGGRLESSGGAFSSEGGASSSTETKNVSAIDNLDNVNAETGVMTSTEGSGSVKGVSGGTAASTGSVEAKAATGKPVAGLSPRSASGSTTAAEPGGAGTQSLGKMPDKSNPKSAAFYQNADAVADKINDTGGAASGMKGFVNGMESSEFSAGKFTGNAGQLSQVAEKGARAASFVDKYNGADQAFKDANKQKFQNAQKQMAQAQHVLSRSGVTSASGQNIMSATQWRTTSANIASAYARHSGGNRSVDNRRVDQQSGPQRAAGRQARAQSGGQRPAAQRSRGGRSR